MSRSVMDAETSTLETCGTPSPPDTGPSRTMRKDADMSNVTLSTADPEPWMMVCTSCAG